MMARYVHGSFSLFSITELLLSSHASTISPIESLIALPQVTFTQSVAINFNTTYTRMLCWYPVSVSKSAETSLCSNLKISGQLWQAP